MPDALDDEVTNDGIEESDLNATVENPEEVRSEAEAVDLSPPVVDSGEIGTASRGAVRGLDGTGLETAARGVLAKRGINITAIEGIRELASLRSPGGGMPMRDILEASVRLAPSPPLTRSVLESVLDDADGDGRERIFDTDAYPYSAIASLEITARDGSMWIGTAWFVSPFTLITAGHCVFVRDALNPAANGWVRSIRVIPGRNGTALGSEPFGSVIATRFRSVTGWVNHGRPESDYGAILLPDGASPNGSEVGTFGVGVFNDVDLLAMNLNIAGYPGDKKNAERQTLWFDAKKTAHVTPQQVFYDVDTYGGQSGAPVYVVAEEKRITVAVHAYGTSGAVTSNSGTRINQQVLERIQTWKS